MYCRMTLLSSNATTLGEARWVNSISNVIVRSQIKSNYPSNTTMTNIDLKSSLLVPTVIIASLSTVLEATGHM